MKDTRFTLLIADDEPMILRGLSQNIAWETLDVRVVARETDGITALHALEVFKPDIAIVDICMPRCDGLSLIERARNAGIDTAFIILSGYDDFGYAQRAISCGVAAYLLKPINKQELMNTVKDLCEKRIRQRHGSVSYPSFETLDHRHIQALQGQFLMDVAIGRTCSEEEIKSSLTRLNIPLPFEGVCVILLDCPFQVQTEALEELDTILFSCPHVIFFQEMDQIYLAAHVASLQGAYGSLKKLLAELVSHLRCRDIHVTVSLGTWGRTLLELPISLRAVRNAQQYRLYELPDGVYNASDIDCSPPPEGSTCHWDTAQLCEAILLHDEKAIEQQLDSFLQSLFYIPMPPPSFLLGMCTYMIMDVQQRLLSYISTASIILPMDEAHVQLHALTSVPAISHWLYAALLRISDDIAQNGLHKYAPIVNKAKAYIENNLLKKLLLCDVAAHVHLSENYLATLFKNYTGQSFRHYLLDRKMEKARELLLKEHRSIGDVAQMLGYEDYRAFTRAFKKHTGLRPSDIFFNSSDERRNKK